MILADFFWNCIYLSTIIWWVIILHETGHLYYLYRKGIKAIITYNYWKGEIKVGNPKDYQKLSRGQKRSLYLWGIILGTLPIIIASLLNILYAVLIPIYIYSCRSDIQNLKKCKAH